MDMATFAQRLKTTREERNVSAKELADAIGINKATIHHYERADFKSVKTAILHNIANYLYVSPEYLVGASDQKEIPNETAGPTANTTGEEELLLQLFRQVPADHRQAVLEQFAVDVVRYALKHDQ